MIVAVALVAGVLVSASTAPAQTPAPAAPRWTVVPSASPPGPPNGELNDVACATPASCFAVGSDGGGGSLIQRWNGSAWTIVANPAVKGSAFLASVACPSATLCFAVGSVAQETDTTFSVLPLIERWNGTKWSVMKAPGAGAEIIELNGVSCTGPTSCVAVGDYANEDSDAIDQHAMSERWNGTSWSLVAVPGPATSRAEILIGVSCTSATSCIGVGAYLKSDALPLAEHWNGTKWSVLATPVPTGFDGAGLSGVSCSSATDCFAVGSAFHTDNDNDATVTEHWNGTAWSVVASPNPDGTTGAELNAVACTSATDCTAVGDSFTLSGSGPVLDEVDAAVIEHWDGTAWSVVPGASALYTELTGVACTSTTHCFAVGDAGLVDQWNGSAWSLAPFGAMASQSILTSIACPVVNRCFAVGEFESTDGVQILVEQFDGAHWTIVNAPIPAGAPNSALYDVSCTSVDDCTAVGLYQLDADTNPTLIEHWNGTEWSVVPSPSPTDVSAAQLTQVSCANANSCDAVGFAFGATQSTPFGEHWDGTAWTLVTVPKPAFASATALSSLACPGAKLCFLVGGYEAFSGTGQLVARTLIERWNGTSWKIVKSPNPGNNGDLVQFSDVACSGASQCLAVGVDLSLSGSDPIADSSTLVARWNGKQWTLAPGHTPVEVALNTTGLACRSAVSCYAVGESFDTGGTSVQHWTGTRWVTIASANPPAAPHQAGLADVSCPTSTWCAAVGASRNVYGSFTLGERGA